MIKRRSSNVYYDGIGFVNNIGKSKYWGVSINPNYTKRTEYRVCVNFLDNENVTYYVNDCCVNLNEKQVAQLAAPLYQFRYGIIPSYVDVKVGNVIYRLDKPHRKIYKLKGVADNLIQLDEAGLPLSKKKKHSKIIDKPTHKDLSDKEQQLFKVVNDLLTGSKNLSNKFKSILKDTVDRIT